MINILKTEDTRLQDVNEEEILAANIRFHRAEAEVYDIRHGELFNAFTQRQLRKIIKKTLTFFHKIPEMQAKREILALDCGAGTGNISGKMLMEGCIVDAVDISQEMLAVMGAKFKSKYDGRYRLINQDINSFLSSKESKDYDLIAFSSTLHHVPDYRITFSQAIKVLKRPGIIMVLHEPLPKERTYIGSLSTAIRKIDRFVWKYKGKILRKKGLKEPISDMDAYLTDFHSRTGGVNPEAFLQLININGGEVLQYSENSENMRHCWSAWLDNFLSLRKDGYHLVVLFR